MTTDRSLPADLLKELADLRKRVQVLETQQPQISQTIPLGFSFFPVNSSGYHEHSNTTDTQVNTGRVGFTAQYLHYSVASDGSLLGGGATEVVGIQLNVPGLAVKQDLTALAPGIYAGALDLFDLLGEVNRGRELDIQLYSRRVGGTGSTQVAYTNNLLLRVHDFAFYGG